MTFTDVPTRTLSRTAITVPAVGVGCWPIGGPDVNLGMPMGWSTARDVDAHAGLRKAYELGARLFDTADVYGHGRSERLLGGLVEEVLRDQLVLTSKVGYFAGTAEHGYHPGHMRRQLEKTLENLGTDYLDVYFLHHPDFGEDDQWLPGAVTAMHDFRAEGLIRAIGMRGPHRYAPERLSPSAAARPDKISRFRDVFAAVQPQILAVRDNLLTPAGRTKGVLALAAEHGCGVLFNKPLSQGLLTATYLTGDARTFGDGDHRLRKRWFTPAATALIGQGLRELQQIVGEDPAAIIRVALWSCLSRFEHAAVLVGFTTSTQMEQNLSALTQRPTDEQIRAAREVMGHVQQRLDADGQVFTDEVTAAAR
jgi:aryl-alcohol dehydrogenase-like predicted oxidoreductase